jgi:hypothetical protein
MCHTRCQTLEVLQGAPARQKPQALLYLACQLSVRQQQAQPGVVAMSRRSQTARLARCRRAQQAQTTAASGSLGNMRDDAHCSCTALNNSFAHRT